MIERIPFGKLERHDRPIELLPAPAYGTGAPFPFSLIDPGTIEIRPMGFLRSLDIIVTGSGPERPYSRPRAAVERTRSRRALAGARRTKRHPVRRPGPSGRRPRADDSPWNTISTVDLSRPETASGYDLWLLNKIRGKA